jgi:subtilisin family serine protease
MDAGVANLRNAAGTSQIAFAADFAGNAVNIAQIGSGDVVVFNSLGVAVANVDPDQAAGISAMVTADSAIHSVEPEPIFFTSSDGLSPDAFTYLRGYRDAVNHLYEQLTGEPGTQTIGALAGETFQDTAEATWGLQAAHLLESDLSGRGVKVAVLDTGLDLDHPDFQNRLITSESFIPNQEVQDENGHGTHCIGTSCGPRQPAGDRRYGIAFEAEIFAGKVLSNQGSALGRSTLAGIEWAVQNGCHVISMSLGARVGVNEPFLNAMEAVARAALRNNALIVAAAGNHSDRSRGKIEPVNSPANCPSIMAVAAVDRFLRLANFSCGGINDDGHVDIAGPGVDVFSSAPEPAPPRQPPFFRLWSTRYDTISGTSMATPHVAGVAALLRQAHPDLDAAEIWRLLSATARSMSLPARDVGVGLVQLA